ncbi:uncharacterized protein [Palaemon carinicauda]|uniref:uncharacterized protein n=1 Tax=Palaemon carinicauda TaxID=392227 RepID=UPI0035B5C589
MAGKGKNAHAALPADKQGNFEAVRKALIEAYKLSPENWRRQWRGLTKSPTTSWSDWGFQKDRLNTLWVEAAKCTTYDNLLELFKIEDFHRNAPPALSIYISEKNPATFRACCEYADEYELVRFKSGPPSSVPSGKSKPRQNPISPTKCGNCGRSNHLEANCRLKLSGQSTESTKQTIKPKVKVAKPNYASAYCEVFRWIEGVTKDLPTVELRVTTPQLSKRYRLGVVSNLGHEGYDLLLGQDLLRGIQRVPLRCMKAVEPEPETENAPPAEDKWLADIDLGEVPWLSEVAREPSSYSNESEPRTPETYSEGAVLLTTTGNEANPNTSPGVSGESEGEASITPEDLGSRTELIKSQLLDKTLKTYREAAYSDEAEMTNLSKENFLLKEGVLFRVIRGPHDPAEALRRQVVVPRNLRLAVLHMAHEGLGGPFGVKRTTHLIQPHFFWPGLQKSVKAYVASCHPCQVAGNPNQVVPRAPLQPIPSAGIPFHDVLMDYVGPLPRSKRGNRFLLTMIDRFTRYLEAVPTRCANASHAVRGLTQFFCRFGFPATVQSDKGSHFMAREFKAAMEYHGVHHQTSTAYHPESQGLVERSHQTLKTVLTKLGEAGSSDREENLPYALFALRQARSETKGYSPFKLLYAHSTYGPLDILYEAWEDSSKASWVEELPDIQAKLRTAWEIAKASEAKVQGITKGHVDREAQDRSFEVGDQVLVLRPGEQRPLSTKFTGPHKILGKKGKLNYLVDCGIRRAKWLHINLLKPYQQRANVVGTVTQVHSPESNSEVLANFKLVTPALDTVKRGIVKNLLLQHPQVVRDTLGHTQLLEHKIDLVPGTCPIRQNYYRLNPQRAERVSEQIKLQLSLGLIEESESPWASPVVLVPKEGGGDRLCIDFHKLNAVTKPESYPLPRIEDCLKSLGESPYLSKIDLEKGYWQVPLAEESRPLTAFITRDGLYQCRVMPFGLRNAPSCFQRLMNKVLAGISNCVVYLDDIVIFSKTWEEHLQTLRKVLRALQKANLVINLKECTFGGTEITYLGHQVGRGKIMPKDANICAIQEMPYPRTKKEAQRFLGMVQYFRRFVPNFSQVAAPITDLFKGKKLFCCTDECRAAYDHLKGILMSRPVLRAPDYTKPFALAVDASDIGIETEIEIEIELESEDSLIPSPSLTLAVVESVPYVCVSSLSDFVHQSKSYVEKIHKTKSEGFNGCRRSRCLGNEVGGALFVPCPIVTEKPLKYSPTTGLQKDYPSLFSSGVATRIMKKEVAAEEEEIKGRMNLEGLFSKEEDFLDSAQEEKSRVSPTKEELQTSGQEDKEKMDLKEMNLEDLFSKEEDSLDEMQEENSRVSPRKEKRQTSGQEDKEKWTWRKLI